MKEEDGFLFEMKHSLKPNTKGLNSFEWSYSSEFILTSGIDSEAKIINVQTGRLERTLKSHSEEIKSAIWVNNDKNIVTASVDKKLILWNFKGEQIHSWNGHVWLDIAGT